MTKPSKGANHFLVLDGLRGVAAVCVLLFHFHGYFLPGAIFGSGYLAVDFFFMLSGFVIGYAYEGRLLKDMGIGEFLLRRMTRLYPLIALTTVVGAVLLVAQMKVVPGQFTLGDIAVATASALTLFPLFSSPVAPGRVYPLNNNLWSLFFELIANLVYAAFIRVASLRVMAVVTVIALVPYAYVACYLDLSTAGVLVGSFALGLVRVAFPFAMGVLVYKARQRFPDAAVGVPPAVLAVVLVAILISPHMNALFELPVVAIVFPLFVIEATAGTSTRGAVSRFWTASGTLSYAIYLVHIPLRGAMAFAVHKLFPVTPYPWGGLLVLAVVISAAYAFTYYFDLPVQRMLKNGVLKQFSLRPAKS